jgi:hypothetical protein
VPVKPPVAQISKSFLVLFFKKELLACLAKHFPDITKYQQGNGAKNV